MPELSVAVTLTEMVLGTVVPRTMSLPPFTTTFVILVSPTVSLAGVFAARGGDILVQAGKDTDFVKLCKTLGVDRLVTDARFERRGARVQNHDVLRPILAQAIAGRDRDELYEALVGAGVYVE